MNYFLDLDYGSGSLMHYNKNHGPDGKFTESPGYMSGGDWKKLKKIQRRAAKENYKQAKLQYKIEKSETKAAKASGDKQKYNQEKIEDRISKQVTKDLKKIWKDNKPKGPSYRDVTGRLSDSTSAVDKVINKFSDDNYVRRANRDLGKWKDKSTKEIWDMANREEAENAYLGAREKKARYSNARRTGTRATKIILAGGTIAAGVYFTKKAIQKTKGE